MAEDIRRAQETFAKLCSTLDGHNWHYKKDEAKLEISCGARGEDLPMDITINVDAQRSLVMLLSHIPFVVPEDKRIEVAIAVSIVNNRLIEGCFDFDLTDGHMFFRMVTSFLESDLGPETFSFLLFCSCQTIDDFNDKFLMISKGDMSIEQFVNSLN